MKALIDKNTGLAVLVGLDSIVESLHKMLPLYAIETVDSVGTGVFVDGVVEITTLKLNKTNTIKSFATLPVNGREYNEDGSHNELTTQMILNKLK